jgi:class 3 adenylate cyclase/tetratricopeptide (TPR) repeat protein
MSLVRICARCGGENPDGFRHCGFCGAALDTPVAGRRKLATMVFCDVSGSTALGERVDAEAVQLLMQRYFGEMRAALERHGGMVEKFIGDAVVAGFGVPEAHEDDALRACRAALEMQTRIDELNEEFERRFAARISIRIGVNSGEVVAAGDETLVTGDAVNVAARLEQAAASGEVLVGEATYRLVRDTVTVEAVEPLVVKGKSEPLAAFRLLDVRGVGRALRRTTAPLVGREQELAFLEREFEAVVADSCCRLVTVVGEPGVGKTRLTAELIDLIRSRARSVRGACLSYGEGITYWAIGEIVRELARIDDEHTPKQARALIDALVDSDPDADAIASRVGQLLGIAETASTVAETAWAVRRVLSCQAGKNALVVVVDDIHWAEPLLLDVLAGLPAGLPTAPILVVCLARPELLENHPEWEATIRLEPLPAPQVGALLSGLLGEAPVEVRERLARASSGNPLFAEELAALTLEAETTAETLPTSIDALLGARIDRLEVPTRSTLERGAIEGEVFHRGAVVELTAPESRTSVPKQLEELVERDLVHPAAAHFGDETAFRFKHILVRDAAYQATAKTLRAVLHEQFANWLVRVADERVTEYEEIIGYHLEQSHRYRIELGPADSATQALAARAAKHLTAAGLRACDRDDRPAAIALLSRAAGLDTSSRLAILTLLGELLHELGEFSRAADLLDEAIDTARERSEPAVEGVARVLREVVKSRTGEASLQQVLSTANEAAAVLEQVGDDAQLALVLDEAAEHTRWLGRGADAVVLSERALEGHVPSSGVRG